MLDSQTIHRYICCIGCYGSYAIAAKTVSLFVINPCFRCVHTAVTRVRHTCNIFILHSIRHTTLAGFNQLGVIYDGMEVATVCSGMLRGHGVYYLGKQLTFD